MLVYRRRIWKWAHRGLIALLLVALWLPLLAMLLGIRDQYTQDRRQLADMPGLRLSRRSLLEFPQGFEAYFNDHFGCRGRLIGWNNRFKVHGLKVSTSPNVILGRDGWLFYLPRPVQNVAGPYTPEQLETWRHILEHRQQWLARRGCRYLLVLPPTKQTVYPDKMPALVIPHASPTRLEQLIAHLRDHSTVPVVDVREAMREARKTDRLYHRNDAHWNGRGAFAAYQEVGRRLSEWFPSIQPLPRSGFRDVVSLRPGGDLAGMIGEATYRQEEMLDLAPLEPQRARRSERRTPPLQGLPPADHLPATELDDPRLPRAVMFHDSFNVKLQPFLSEHFRRIVYYWVEDFHPEIIDQEHPDVVIHEIVEWKLEYLMPTDFAE